jgi:beta-galactosidase
MGSVIAKWANSPKTGDLFRSRPAKGDIGILFVPESEIAASLMPEPENYPQSARGAYMAFHDSNIQADFVHINDIDKHDFLYLPYPIMLSGATARKVTEWVERGGKLISEGTPGYFDERAHAGTVQPAQNLNRLFGAREKSVAFTPDLLENLTFRFGEMVGVSGGINRQSYTPEGGKPVGWYADGTVAAVENTFGKGRTLLIGTHPGAGYHRHHGSKTREFFSSLLAWAGREQNVKRTGDLAVRLHTGDGGTYLWIINHKTTPAGIEIATARKLGNWRKADVLWGTTEVTAQGSIVKATVPSLDAIVVRLVE